MKKVPFQATVLKYAAPTAVLTVASDPACDAGNILNLETEAGFRAVGILSSVVHGECPLLNLTGLSWVGARPRAERIARAYQVGVECIGTSDPRRTVGQTINLSATGVRVRLRNTIEIGVLAKLVIHVGGSAPLEVFGCARRIIDSETTDRGYDVAFSFERWVQGKRGLYDVLGLPLDHTTPGQLPASDSWFSASN